MLGSDTMAGLLPATGQTWQIQVHRWRKEDVKGFVLTGTMRGRGPERVEGLQQ